MKLLIVAALSLAACGGTHTERTWDKSQELRGADWDKTQADLNRCGQRQSASQLAANAR